MKFRYFAYGSNMLPARLIHRCASAKLIGTGVAPDFRLGFAKPGKDGSGKAMLVAAPGARLLGALFEIDISERAALDRHEGSGYRRDDRFRVECPVSGAACLANTYLATSSDAQLRPFDWYLAVVIAGAIHHSMHPARVRALKDTAFIEDPETFRTTRLAAIKALQDHGISDYRTLL